MTFSLLWAAYRASRTKIIDAAVDRLRTEPQSVTHIWLATKEAPLCTATSEQYQNSMPRAVDAICRIYVAPMGEWERADVRQCIVQSALCEAF